MSVIVSPWVYTPVERTLSRSVIFTLRLSLGWLTRVRICSYLGVPRTVEFLLVLVSAIIGITVCSTTSLTNQASLIYGFLLLDRLLFWGYVPHLPVHFDFRSSIVLEELLCSDFDPLLVYFLPRFVAMVMSARKQDTIFEEGSLKHFCVLAVIFRATGNTS